MARKSGLGKGLGALISDSQEVKDTAVQTSTDISKIDINRVVANPHQPRTEFREEQLLELAQSIEELGLIQPITVRKLGGGHYQLIAGERRLRASKLAGKETIQAWIRETNDDEMLELALVENIQREELNPIEISLSYERLLKECSLTQEEVSKRVGKSRSSVANFMRLLKLPLTVQKGLKNRVITMGHARALVPIDDEGIQNRIYSKIEKEGLSVRATEELVKRTLTPISAAKPTSQHPSIYTELESHLSSHFSTEVKFKMNKKGKGQIVIPFGDTTKLEQIISILDKLNAK